MTIKEQAELILHHLSQTIQVNWSYKNYYLKAIEQALREINKEGKQ